MIVQRPNPGRVARLSKENLRLHTEICSKDNIFLRGLASKEYASHYEKNLDNKPSGHLAEPTTSGVEASEQHFEYLRSPALDVLDLFLAGTVSEAPTSPYVVMSPTQDTRLWMMEQACRQSAFDFQDPEELELQRLASEMAESHAPAVVNRELEAIMGSPRASSDTLSVFRYRELGSARRGARLRKPVVVRRHRREGHSPPVLQPTAQET